MRVGKTRICLKSIEKHSENYIKPLEILVLYPTIDIKNSWIKECDLINYHPNITYSTFISIEKIANKDWDYIVVDESHGVPEENILPILGELIKRHANAVLISGTYSSKTLENLKSYTNLDLVINYPTEEAIKDGIISDYSVDMLLNSI